MCQIEVDSIAFSRLANNQLKQKNAMKTKPSQSIHLAGCVIVLAFATGCGSSRPFEKAISLSDGVSIEMVRIPNGLWFGKYEVTQSQWESVMGDNPSRFQNPDNPVERVSWDDCERFLEKINELPSVKESGLSFRLPTVKEWDFACGAGSTGPLCRLADGTEITEDTIDQVGWFSSAWWKKEAPHPVGQKLPNAFGLYDMLGNVWEWTVFLQYGFVAEEPWSCLGGGTDGIPPDYRWNNGNPPTHSFQSEFIGLRLCAENRNN